jgi:hypothetical protein
MLTFMVRIFLVVTAFSAVGLYILNICMRSLGL